MRIHDRAADGLQSVAAARAVQADVATVLQEGGSDELKKQGAVIDKLCQDYVSSIFSTARNMIEMVAEATPPISELVMLHNIMESSEGPPNQPMRELFADISRKLDSRQAAFEAALATEMARFDEAKGE
jgi:hypothetical protein